MMLRNWDNKRLELVTGDTSPGIARVTLSPREPWVRSLPAFIADVSGGKVSHNLLTPHLVRHATFRSTFGPCAIFGFHHFHGVLHGDGNLSVHDTDDDRARWRVDSHISHSAQIGIKIPRIVRRDSGYVCSLTEITEADVEKINDPVFVASPVEPDNYGMWLIMVLPSVYDYLKLDDGRRLLCWIRSPWQRKLLNFMGVQDDRIIVQQPWRLYTTPTLSMHQYSHVDVTPTPFDLAVFREITRRALDSTEGGPRAEKIFVSRRGFSQKVGYRNLTNEGELIEKLEDRGFKIVEPETLSFAAQVRLFSEARVVIGVGGAAMFNTIFCKPGTSVVSIESSSAFVYGHSNLFATCKLNFAFIFGTQDLSDPAPVHKRWSLNVDEAVRYIDAFL